MHMPQVPNLFAKDEVMTIIEGMTPKAKRAGRGITPPEVYAYFVEQCRANLHMVLAMSPVGDAFRCCSTHCWDPAAVQICNCSTQPIWQFAMMILYAVQDTVHVCLVLFKALPALCYAMCRFQAHLSSARLQDTSRS